MVMENGHNEILDKLEECDGFGAELIIEKPCAVIVSNIIENHPL